MFEGSDAEDTLAPLSIPSPRKSSLSSGSSNSKSSITNPERLRSIILDDSVKFLSERATSEEIQADRAIRSPRRESHIQVHDLLAGDVIFVKKRNAVSSAQGILKALKISSGESTSAHCMIVTQNTGLSCQVAHITTSGGVIAYLEDPLDRSKVDSVFWPDKVAELVGTVYRLECAQDIARLTSKIALALISDYKIGYSIAQTMNSLFKPVKAGGYLKSKKTKIFNSKVSNPEQKPDLQLFCSEFVIKCYQEAIVQTESELEIPEEDHRWIDLNGSACPPMVFEDFLVSNMSKHGDWKHLGLLTAEFM